MFAMNQHISSPVDRGGYMFHHVVAVSVQRACVVDIHSYVDGHGLAELVVSVLVLRLVLQQAYHTRDIHVFAPPGHVGEPP